MKRERDQPAAILGVIPWWGWGVMAVLSFLLFSWLVAPPGTTSTGPGLAPAVSRSWGRSLAFLAMIIVPAMFALAAIASVLVRMSGQRRDASQAGPAFGLEFAPLVAADAVPAPGAPIDASRLSLELLRTLNAKQLQDVCTAYFGALRFHVEPTRHGAGAVDLRLHEAGASAPGILVQCKAWDSGEVGEGDVRALLGAMTVEKVGEGVVVTTRSFSAAAADLARDAAIHLIDGPDLLAKLLALDPAEQARILRL